MAGRVEDKVVIVSGAGAIGPGWGNGKASAVLYAREGARVFCVDLKAEAAQETADLIAGEGNQGLELQPFACLLCVSLGINLVSHETVYKSSIEYARSVGRLRLLPEDGS